METQPSLFDQAPGQQSDAVNIDAVAKRISDNARPIEYDDRTSEAAIDQGWGTVTAPEAVRSTQPPKAKVVRPFVGKIRGESEGEVTPAGHDEAELLTDEQKQTGLISVGVVRRILANPQER